MLDRRGFLKDIAAFLIGAGSAETLAQKIAKPNMQRVLKGMEIATLQWMDRGGLRLNFKIMAIMVPGQWTATGKPMLLKDWLGKP